MRAKKFKNALSLFMAFAVGLSCVSPVSFAEVEPTSKREFIERAKRIEQGSNTDQSYEKLQKAIKKAEEDLNAGKTDVELELTVDELNKAIEEFAKDANTLTPLKKVYKEFEAEIKRAENLKDGEDTFPGAKDILQAEIVKARNDLNGYKDNLDSLNISFDEFKVSVAEYEEGKYTPLKEFEKKLKQYDSNDYIISVGTLPSEMLNPNNLKLSLERGAVKPIRVYRTKNGYKMVLALRREKKYVALNFIGEVYQKKNDNFVKIEPISTYTVKDIYNDNQNGSDMRVKGKNYPKEVIIDIKKDTKTLPIEMYIPGMEGFGKGTQTENIKLNWDKFTEKIVTTKLEDLIEDAKKIEKGKKTKSAFNELQGAINTAENKIKNIKTEEELDKAINDLNSAIEKFKKSTDIDTENLKKSIENAKNIPKADKIDEAIKELSDAIEVAEKVLTDFESQEEVNNAEKALKEAIGKFEKSVKKSDKQKFESKIAEAKDKLSNGKKVKEANDELKKAIDDANEFLKNIVTKTNDELGVAITKIEKAIEDFEKKVKDEDWKKLRNLINKANFILNNPDKYEQEGLQELYKATSKAKEVLNKSDFLQDDYDKAIKALEDALGKIKEIETEKTYTVKAKLQAVGVSSPPMLDTAMNDVVKVIEKGSKARYELQFKSITDGAKTVRVTEISAIENGNKQKADKFNNSSSEYNETFVISRNSTNELKIPLEILTDDKDANGGNPQKFDLVFDWSTKNENPQNPQGNKVNLTLLGDNIKSNPSAGEIEKNTKVTVTVTPESNMKVKSFTVNGVERKSDLVNNVFNFRIEENTTIKVEYEEKNPKPAEQKLKLTLVGENITSNPIAGQIKKGTDVTVTVAPAANKEVSLFTVNGVDKKSDLINNQYKFKIDVDTEIKVEYKDKAQNPAEEKVKLTLVGENISSNPIAGQIKKGTDVIVTVAPAANKEVSLFTVNGVDKKSDLVNNQYKFKIDVDTEIKVEYKDKAQNPTEQKFNLKLVGENITSNPIAGQIKKGTDVTVTVAPASNKEVSLFTVNGADKKSDLINNQYKFKIDVDTEIKVEYKDKQTSSGGNSGGGSGGSSSSSRERDRDRDREIDRDRTSSRNSDRKSDNTVTIDEEEVAKSAPDINFIDVKNNHWAIDYIRFVVQRGIMVGVDKDRFDPNGKLSRAMLISMLARISKEKVEDAKQVEGIPQNQWYSKDMNWAVNAKIVQKNKDGKYDPIEALTRSEMATIIGRYLEYKGIKLEETKKEISFKDMNNMSEETMK
ncbi:SLH domain protein, partial [Peptostreptococcaceae bacterium AS15]